MSFIVILACLGVQWFLAIPLPRQLPWAEKYLAWTRKHFLSLTHEHGLFSFLLLVLPILIIASLIFTLTYHLFGLSGYLILSFILLWYFVDITDLKSNAKSLSNRELFQKTYEKIFVLLFWYFFFGPMGLILYVTVTALHAQLSDQKYFVLALGVLDWLPIRLMGLSYALAGNFSVAFKEWTRMLFEGVSGHQNQVTVFGELALSSDTDALSLIRRVLLIWLFFMALIKLGAWLG